MRGIWVVFIQNYLEFEGTMCTSFFNTFFFLSEPMQLKGLSAGLLPVARVWILLEVDFFPNINRVPLNTAFHYHPPNILHWLKYCWKESKTHYYPPSCYDWNTVEKNANPISSSFFLCTALICIKHLNMRKLTTEKTGQYRFNFCKLENCVRHNSIVHTNIMWPLIGWRQDLHSRTWCALELG